MKKADKFPDPEGKFAYWHSIPRKEIPWYPTIDEDGCIGCKLCYVSCGRNVFDFDFERNRAVVARPYNCLVGCSTCATICPVGAIEFPPRDIVQKIEREYHILKEVQRRAYEKKYRADLAKVREEVVKKLSQVRARTDYELVGHFLERDVIVKMQEFLRERPCDIINVQLEVPSIKGCFEEKAPSILKFTLVSTNYEDTSTCEAGLESIFNSAKVVTVSKT